MLLAIDIGNTNITMGAYDGDTLVFVSRIATDRSRTPDQYAIEFKQIFALHDAPSHSFSGAALSSVVPELSTTMCEAIERITGHRPMVLGPGIKTGMNILIDNPAQLGADLLGLILTDTAAVHNGLNGVFTFHDGSPFILLFYSRKR